MDKRLVDFLGNSKYPVDEDRKLFVGPITPEGMIYLEHELGMSASRILLWFKASFDEKLGVCDLTFKDMMRLIAALTLQFSPNEEKDKMDDEKYLTQKLAERKRELRKIMRPAMIVRYANMIAESMRFSDIPEELSDFTKAEEMMKEVDAEIQATKSTGDASSMSSAETTQ